LTDPVVSSSSHRKDRKPFRMVDTDQPGDHSSGWNSDIEQQIETPVAKRPEGVTMESAGAL